MPHSQAAMKCLLVGAFIAGLSTEVAAEASCDDNLGVWYSKPDNGDRHIVYGTQALGYLSEIIFEKWRGARLAWRLRSEITCSQGASICRADIPNHAGDPTIQNGVTSVIVERIDENDDGLSEYLVFAGLGQQLWYANGARVDWVDLELASSDDRVVLPNVFRFERCQPQLPEIELIAARRALELSRRPLFGLPEVCKAAAGLKQEIGPDQLGDGIWGTSGSRVFGWEYDCQIQSIENGVADLHCDMGGFGVWDDHLKWEEAADSIRIAGNTSYSVELSRCSLSRH